VAQAVASGETPLRAGGPRKILLRNPYRSDSVGTILAPAALARHADRVTRPGIAEVAIRSADRYRCGTVAPTRTAEGGEPFRFRSAGHLSLIGTYEHHP
jgi:hypothetical protein